MSQDGRETDVEQPDGRLEAGAPPAWLDVTCCFDGYEQLSSAGSPRASSAFRRAGTPIIRCGAKRPERLLEG